jgi:hypothetical protein
VLVSVEHYISLQLGKWIHPHEIKTAEDILSDPSSIPYTKDINEALKPHRGVLHRLLTAPNSSHYETSSKVIPAKKWLQDNNKDLSTAAIPHVGTLSVIERAQIANWFETHISREKDVWTLWVSLLPIAHAHTLFIAYQMTKGQREICVAACVLACNDFTQCTQLHATARNYTQLHATTYNAHKPKNQLLPTFLIIYTHSGQLPGHK